MPMGRDLNIRKVYWLLRNIEMELEEELEKQPAHHKQHEVAYNRPDYREAKRERSVKVCFLYPMFSCWAACGHTCMQSCQIIIT